MLGEAIYTGRSTVRYWPDEFVHKGRSGSSIMTPFDRYYTCYVTYVTLVSCTINVYPIIMIPISV